MGAIIRMPELDKMIAAGTLNPQEATRIKRLECSKMDAQIRRGSFGPKPDQDSDPFVNWNFKKDWKREELPVGTSCGTDYDYFNAVVAECIRLFEAHAPGVRDPDPLGYNWYGGTGVAYKKAWQVWSHGQHMVHFGPTVDYALFLENRPKGSAPNIQLLYTFGVLHAVAAKLQQKYIDVMSIYATAMKPKQENIAAATRKHRKEPIEHYPYIMITHRHARVIR